ncbi:hypothetical protein CXU13_04270 [Akkermansia muciniphila]|nr:hypothetical protein CXU13_04270 [Akkermansia muciniphila]
MKRYLLIFLLSGMDTGALKAEKVLDGFDEEPFEQPVILPEKTRLSPVAAYMGEPSAGGTGKAVRAVLAASGGGGRKQMAGPEWKGGNGLDCRRIVFPVEQLFQDARQPVLPVGSRLLFSGTLPASLLRDALLPGNTYENPEKADEICRAAFKNLKRMEGTLPAVPDTGAFRGMRVPGSGHLQRAVVAGEPGL